MQRLRLVEKDVDATTAPRVTALWDAGQFLCGVLGDGQRYLAGTVQFVGARRIVSAIVYPDGGVSLLRESWLDRNIIQQLEVGGGLALDPTEFFRPVEQLTASWSEANPGTSFLYSLGTVSKPARQAVYWCLEQGVPGQENLYVERVSWAIARYLREHPEAKLFYLLEGFPVARRTAARPYGEELYQSLCRVYDEISADYVGWFSRLSDGVM